MDVPASTVANTNCFALYSHQVWRVSRNFRYSCSVTLVGRTRFWRHLMVNRSVCWGAIVWGGYSLIQWLTKAGHQVPGVYSAYEIGFVTLDILMIVVGV